MHPDVLHDPLPARGRLSSRAAPELQRAEALRRLLERSERYPQCPHCGRALLADGPHQFTCPNGHMTLDRRMPTRWELLWQRVRDLFGRAQVPSGS